MSFFGKTKKLDINQLQGYLKPTQDLIDEQIGLGRLMMDPNSRHNQMMRNMMNQRFMQSAAQTGAQTGQQMEKMGAMSGVSDAQTMMQARMGMNQSMGQVGNQLSDWTSNYMQNTYGQGVGLLGNMIGAQQGLDENYANAYVQNINAHNQRIANRKSQLMGLVGAGLSFGSSFIPKPSANTFTINTGPQ